MKSFYQWVEDFNDLQQTTPLPNLGTPASTIDQNAPSSNNSMKLPWQVGPFPRKDDPGRPEFQHTILKKEIERTRLLMKVLTREFSKETLDLSKIKEYYDDLKGLVSSILNSEYFKKLPQGVAKNTQSAFQQYANKAFNGFTDMLHGLGSPLELKRAIMDGIGGMLTQITLDPNFRAATLSPSPSASPPTSGLAATKVLLNGKNV